MSMFEEFKLNVIELTQHRMTTSFLVDMKLIERRKNERENGAKIKDQKIWANQVIE